MDEAVQVMFGVIAIGIVVVSISGYVIVSRDSLKTQMNDLAISSLKSKCDIECTKGMFDAQIAGIKVSQGTYIYTKDNKICYNIHDTSKNLSTIRCQICKCTVYDGLVLNFTGKLEGMSTRDYDCMIEKFENITISCS
ncbi:hypothetical protein K9M79_07935 [Candidatus Woesearchaeota archaeon]|nr:hypothetical protein [Candidatus Woesearchaeota archaeon]